ncbi:hypothetical protein CGRA01v4_07097 [Colletotrichum graminicola]|nr:hypothetical protein CGRA01v4_07097 [Colletotrichum graminicola]
MLVMGDPVRAARDSPQQSATKTAYSYQWIPDGKWDGLRSATLLLLHALAICLEREPRVMRWIFCQYSSLACLASKRRGNTVAGSEFHNASGRGFTYIVSEQRVTTRIDRGRVSEGFDGRTLTRRMSERDGFV